MRRHPRFQRKEASQLMPVNQYNDQQETALGSGSGSTSVVTKSALPKLKFSSARGKLCCYWKSGQLLRVSKVMDL